MVRGRRVRTNNTNNNVYTNRGITNKVMNGSTNPTDPNSEFRSSGQTLNGTQLSDEQYCASPKRKDCKIDNNVTNLHTALQEMSSTTIITNNNNKKLSSSSSSSKIPCHPDQANYDIFVGSTKSSLQQTSSTIKTRSQQQTAIKNFFRQTKHGGGGINDEIYVNGDTIGAELEIRTTTPTSLINNNIINNLITHEEDTCDGGLFQYSIVQQNCQNLINNNNNSSSNSSSNEQYNMTNNIFLQEPVLSLNVDKSPNQPSSIKINKTLEVNPIFSTITTTTTQQQSLSASINGCYQNHLNGQFNKIVTLNTSPKQQNYNILDDNYEIITTNDYNNDNEPSLYLLLNNDSNSCDSGVVIDKQLELSPNRRRKPTTPHRILCPSPVKHAIVEKSPTSALINNNNNNNLNLLNGGHHQLALVTTKTTSTTTTTTTDEEDEDIGGAEGRRHEEEEINNIIDVNDSEILNNVHGIIGTGLNGVVQKRYPKSRRRLNINQSENNSSITPQIIGGVTLSNQSLKRPNSNNNNNNNNNQKSILNSAKNPSAEQNTNNNYKLTHSKHRTNGHHLHHHSRDNRHGSSHHHQHTQQSQTAAIQQSIGDNKKLTDFYPVRRSVRKTKKVVQEEIMRGIEKAILEGRDDGLKVENFEGKGRGVIAERSFKRGEFVVEYIGDLINTAEANQREKQYSLDENAGCYMYYFKHRNQQYCIDATAETGKLGRLVNHSRNGNLITKVVVVKNHPHLVLIAKDDIRPGEELTYDYGDRSKEALLHHPWLAL